MDATHDQIGCIDDDASGDVIGRLHQRHRSDEFRIRDCRRVVDAVFAVLLSLHREWAGDTIDISKESVGGMEQMPEVFAAGCVAHRLRGIGMANWQTSRLGRGCGFPIGGVRP